MLRNCIIAVLRRSIGGRDVDRPILSGLLEQDEEVVRILLGNCQRRSRPLTQNERKQTVGP